jgi:hypothetical protein
MPSRRERPCRPAITIRLLSTPASDRGPHRASKTLARSGWHGSRQEYRHKVNAE